MPWQRRRDAAIYIGRRRLFAVEKISVREKIFCRRNKTFSVNELFFSQFHVTYGIVIVFFTMAKPTE
jgi:hypothetical protein